MINERRIFSEDDLDIYLYNPITEEEYEKMKKNNVSALDLIMQMNDNSLEANLKAKMLKLLQKIFELKDVLIDVLQNDNVRLIIKNIVESDDEELKRFIAIQLKNAATFQYKSKDTSNKPLIDNELFNALGSLSTSENSSISQNAIDAIILYLKSNVETDTFLSIDVFNQFKKKALQEENSVEKGRYLDAFVDMGRISTKWFEKFNEENIFSEILKIISKDKTDFVFQAFALHLMEKLSDCDLGRDFLLALKNLRQIILILKDSTVEDSNKCRIMQILSFIIFYRPNEINYILKESDNIIIELLNRYLCKEENIIQDNEVYWLLCVVCWSYICSRKKSCDVLHEHLPSISDCVSAKVEHFKEEISCAALFGWIKILDNEFKEEVSPCLIKSMKEFLLPAVLHVCTFKPLPELRANSYELLKHMCKYDWVGKKLVDSIDFKNLILDFSSESDYNCRIKKNAFVKTFVSFHSDLIDKFWTTVSLNKINEYIKLGPFNVPKGGDICVDNKAM